VCQQKILKRIFLICLFARGYKNKKNMCPGTKKFATDRFGRRKLKISPAAPFEKSD
jgi:hypothetical protein